MSFSYCQYHHHCQQRATFQQHVDELQHQSAEMQSARSELAALEEQRATLTLQNTNLSRDSKALLVQNMEAACLQGSGCIMAGVMVMICLLMMLTTMETVDVNIAGWLLLPAEAWASQAMMWHVW